jgi:ABC-type glycerol-3-phosphate transport system permease component
VTVAHLLFSWLRWIDSYKPLIIPWFFGGGAFRIFLFRQFIKSIPEELDQAAEIDGCSTLRIFGQIIVPLMMPAVATVAVLGFMDFWNDFFAPFIYLNNVDKDTIVLRLFRIWSDAEGYMREELHTVMAGNVMVTLPGFIIFFIAQKRFIQGIVTTGIKG